MEDIINSMLDTFIEHIKEENPELAAIIEFCDIEYSKEEVIRQCLGIVDDYIESLGEDGQNISLDD